MKKLIALISLLILATGCLQYLSSDEPILPADCGEHAMGETWQADDGCNQCVCSETGPACTEIACVPEDFCENAYECETKPLVHVECEGNWKCTSNRCAWECTVEPKPKDDGGEGAEPGTEPPAEPDTEPDEELPVCELGWGCKDSSTKAYRGNGCEWSQESVCEYGCSNSECLTACAGVTCSDSCTGDVRNYGGTCVDGECSYSTTTCEYGCANGTCIDPCDGITCEPLCEEGGNSLNYNGTCLEWGTCSYDFMTCEFGCSNGECLTGCEDVSCPNTCDGTTRKFNGTCTAGTCGYETEECPFTCILGNCEFLPGVVFVTSQQWTGNLGGVSGANGKCQAAAEAAGLPGNWGVIIATESYEPVNYLPDIAYRRMDGAIIADNVADLFDGFIDVKINIDEYGNVKDVNVFTGTDSDGQASKSPLGTYRNCSNWTSDLATADGQAGRTNSSNSFWIRDSSDEGWEDNCGEQKSLYCAKIYV
ncbi:MAG: hypothetical protein ABH854_02780 [Candidatus Diapherotrites archaeon]